MVSTFRQIPCGDDGWSKVSAKGQSWNNKDAKSFIDQIDSLQLPKRLESRRQIYVGEKIRCAIRYQQIKKSAEIIDMSSKGIAVIFPEDDTGMPEITDIPLSIDFTLGEQSFSVPAILGNLSMIEVQERSYRRYGLIFKLQSFKDKEAFKETLGTSYIAMKGAIKPVAWCQDPFFFNEVIIFDILGVTNSGLELSYSARCKSLFPNRPIQLSICIPGKGLFVVAVTNSNMQAHVKSNSIQIFVSYENPSKPFLEALSQHLVMFGDKTSPKELKDKEFQVGDLSQAFALSFQSGPQDRIDQSTLTSCDFAPKSPNSANKLAPKGRRVTVRLGPTVAAKFTLAFTSKVEESPILSQDNHNIKVGSYKRSLEIVDFQISQECSLVDMLIPLVQQLIRIAVQAQYQAIVLECTKKIKPVLLKIGFEELGSGSRRLKQGSEYELIHLMELNIKEAVLNSKKQIDEGIWKSIYQSLFVFLKDQMKQDLNRKKSL